MGFRNRLHLVDILEDDVSIISSQIVKENRNVCDFLELEVASIMCCTPELSSIVTVIPHLISFQRWNEHPILKYFECFIANVAFFGFMKYFCIFGCENHFFVTLIHKFQYPFFFLHYFFQKLLTCIWTSVGYFSHWEVRRNCNKSESTHFMNCLFICVCFLGVWLTTL